MALQDVKETADQAVEVLVDALERTKAVRDSTVKLLRDDPVPKTFIGTIRNYRYGVDPTDPNPDNPDYPAHRFEVDGDSGLCFHVCIGSKSFDPFIANADLGMMDDGVLNGRLVRLERRVAPLGMVPVELLGEDLKIRDSLGRILYVGSTVFRGQAGPFEVAALTPADGDTRRILGVTGEDGGSLSYYVDELIRQP